MPAWDDAALMIKLVTLCPGNPSNGLAANSGVVVLFDGKNGHPLAMLDAGELTARRTAAASALASRYLSREDADSLLIVGTGRLVNYLIAAHMTVRPIKHIRVWGRQSDSAVAAVENIKPVLAAGVSCEAVMDLSSAVYSSDIISAATRATEPLIKGEWFAPGTHLDLVGGYRPDMREVDSHGIQRSIVFADTIEGVLAEAGDIIQPINDGDIGRDHIRAELADLCCCRHKGRANADEVTLFKSVGTAFEDLVAGRLAYSCFQQETKYSEKK